METVTFQIVGDHTMHCGGCESAVKFVLLPLPGVQDVQASHKDQRIAIQYDDVQDLSRKQIVEELDRLGYQVEEVRQ